MDPKDYLRRPYARILIPDENGTYSAEILEFPGCFSQGQTADEAMRNLENAAVAWIESSLNHGQEIPPPFSSHAYIGKVALRLPRSIHKKAAQLAERDGTSLNQFLLSAIAARIGAEDLYARIADKLEIRIMTTAANVMTATHYAITEWKTSHYLIDVPLRIREPIALLCTSANV